MPDHQRQLFQQFEKELRDLGGTAFLVDEANVSTKLQAIISGNIQNMVVYQTASLLKWLLKSSLPKESKLSIHWLPEKKPSDFDYDRYRQMMIGADASLIAADYLIAESGAVVLLDQDHRSQMATLLPSTLIVLATVEQIVEDIHVLHKKLKVIDQPQTSIHYIAGPSRTADIEKTLILGVHGPKDLYVLTIRSK